MNVLIVCSGNSGKISPFIKEQVESLKKVGINTEYFLIIGRGLTGYLRNYQRLLTKIKKDKFHLIHAHYGLSGCLCVLQKRLPVVTTFHGGDIDIFYIKPFSILAMLFSRKNIFVNNSDLNRSNLFIRNNACVIPCGIDLKTFYPINNKLAFFKKHKLNKNKKNILFSSSFTRKVKNFSLAQKSLKEIKQDTFIKELDGYTREEVNELMNISDMLLVTSKREASPMVVKEAMACNLPIVSTDVGDIKEIIRNTLGCYIASKKPKDLAIKINCALNFNKRTNGREKINKLEINYIASEIIKVYRDVLTY